MIYNKTYNQIIERAKSRSIDGYVERHHIIPKCLGGTDDRSNIVKLTAKEHFIVHKLLCKIYPNNDKLKMALWRFCVGNDNQKIVSSNDYEFIKKNMSKCFSIKYSGKNNPFYGKSHSIKDRDFISKSKGTKMFELRDGDNLIFSGYCKSTCETISGIKKQTIYRMLSSGKRHDNKTAKYLEVA